MDRRSVIALTLVPALAALAAPARAGGGGGGGSAPDSYSRFATLTASIVRRDGRRGVLSVEAGIDVPDAALRTRATQAEPRLRAAYAQTLQAFGESLSPGRPPDCDRLSRELQAATDRALGRRGAHLLLGTVLVN